MGWKEFAASVIGSLAWPLVVLVLVIVIVANFRTQLRALIARAKSVKGGGVEATFNEQVEGVKDNAEALLEGLQGPVAPGLRSSQAEEPTRAIIHVWEALEETVKALYLRSTDEPELEGIRVPPFRLMLDQLLRAGVIDRAFRETVFRLRQLRNQVAHGSYRPSTEEAASYVQAAADMIDYAVITKPEYLSDRPLLFDRASV